MNAKEKAEELIARFRIISYDLDDIANHKECAMVAVDEIISIGWNLPHYDNNTGVKYWNDVKSELQSL